MIANADIRLFLFPIGYSLGASSIGSQALKQSHFKFFFFFWCGFTHLLFSPHFACIRIWGKASVCLFTLFYFSGNSLIDCDNENQRPPSQTFSSSNAVPGSFWHLDPLDKSNEICYTEREGVSGCEIPAHTMEPSYPETNFNSKSVSGDNLNLNSIWKGENESQFKLMGEDVESDCMCNLLFGLGIIIRLRH